MYVFRERRRENRGDHEIEALELIKWIIDSHYWEEKAGTWRCKWCEAVKPTSISPNDNLPKLCKYNPAVRAALTTLSEEIHNAIKMHLH